jgi:hypothetical protein
VFGSSKRHILKDGRQAVATVTEVGYATVLGMAQSNNFNNMKLKLKLLVSPEGEAPFEVTHSGYFPQFSQPEVGDQYRVRYDPANPTKVEFDTAQAAQDNTAYEAQIVASAAAAVPADLAATGILGRGAVVDVQKTQVGPLIDCLVTVGVRLVDGTDPYRATCHLPLTPDQAELLVPGGTFVTVRADPHDHSRIAVSLTEETPVVTITDPRALEPSERALREGTPCAVTMVAFQRQWLATPAGDEFYALKLRVGSDLSELQVNQPVPAGAAGLLREGAQFSARRLVGEPNVLAIDWTATPAAASAA